MKKLFIMAVATMALSTSCTFAKEKLASITEKNESQTEVKTDAETAEPAATAPSEDGITDEEAIAFIEEFYAKDGWEESDLRKYLGEEALKELELDPEEEDFRDDAIGGKYRGWDLVCGDPVGETDLLDVTKARALGNNQYEKIFTTAYWGDHSQKHPTTYRYTVARIEGELKIVKVEIAN